MASYKPLFLLCLLVLTSLQLRGTCAVTYGVTNRVPRSPGGLRFADEVGYDYTRRQLEIASQFIFRLFEQDSGSDRRSYSRVTVYIDSISGVANTVYNQITISSDYISRFHGDIRREFTGVLYHELTHVWQWDVNAPDGLIEGIADYVRLKAGYAPSNWVQPGGGDRWDQGYDVTARFLDYCNSLRGGFVAELNKRMRNGYTQRYFVDLLGKSVDQLWADYKRRYN